MTTPGPNDMTLNPDEMRRVWLDRYLRNQAQFDARMRTILVQAAEDAQSEIASLAKNSTFSAGVRTAQLKIVMGEIKAVLNDTYREFIPVISDGQRKTAVVAVGSFADTDRAYLSAAFAASGAVNDFIAGQRTQAQIGVANAATRFSHTDIPLSGRVYRSRILATRWIQNTVTTAIARGSSAQQIANAIRSSIRPNVTGGVGYAALRLGRTELNNAFHATTVNLAKDRPWVEGMLWNLSSTHEVDPGKTEVCERYAGRVFSVDDVPIKPHPQCRCYATPQLEAFESFITHLTAGQYRSWISDAA